MDKAKPEKRKEKILTLILFNYRIELLLALILLFDLFSNFNKYVPSWNSTQYLLAYQYGFRSRFLLGTIIRFFTPYLSATSLLFIVYISAIFLIILVSVMLGKLIKKADDSYKIALISSIGIFLASPGSISYLFNDANFGQLETFILIFTIIIITIIVKNKYLLFIPIFTFLSIITHQAYMFTYFPLVFGLLLFESYNQNRKVNYVISLIFTTLITITSFLYIQLSPKIVSFKTSLEAENFLLNRTNISLNIFMIELEYFYTVFEHWNLFVFRNLIRNSVFIGFITFVLVLPIVYILFKIWKNTISNCNDKYMKYILLFLSLAPLCSLPIFVLALDWGRWLAAIFIEQFTFIFFLTYRKFPPMIKTLEKYQNMVKENTFVYIIFIIYLSLLGKFENDDILKLSFNAFKFGKILIKKILLMLCSLF